MFVVVTSIGCSVRRRDLHKNSTWMRCPTFRCVLHLQLFSVFEIENPSVTILHPLPLCFSYQGPHFITSYSEAGASVVVWVQPVWLPMLGGAIKGSWSLLFSYVPGWCWRQGRLRPFKPDWWSGHGLSGLYWCLPWLALRGVLDC